MELYATTRLDKYFKDPLEFKPERWLRGTKDVHSFSHLQFGFGPHMCVGKKRRYSSFGNWEGDVIKLGSIHWLMSSWGTHKNILILSLRIYYVII